MSSPPALSHISALSFWLPARRTRNSFIHAHLFIATSTPWVQAFMTPHLGHCNSFLIGHPAFNIHIFQFVYTLLPDYYWRKDIILPQFDASIVFHCSPIAVQSPQPGIQLHATKLSFQTYHSLLSFMPLYSWQSGWFGTLQCSPHMPLFLPLWVLCCKPQKLTLGILRMKG